MLKEKLVRNQKLVRSTVKIIVATATMFLLAAGTECSAKAKSTVNNFTAQAVKSYEAQNLQQALEYERKALSASHRSIRSLINLGIIEQSLGNQKNAIAYFEKAKSVDATNWEAQLGLAKSLMLTGREIESIAVLQEMSNQAPECFEKQCKLSQAFLFFNKSNEAVKAALEAQKLAKSATERAHSAVQLYLSYIQSNQIQSARELEDEVLTQGKPQDDQVYVRAATMISVLYPREARKVLLNAIINLNKTENSGSFFRLAQIFDEKARFVSYDRTKYSDWLNFSEMAYKQALKLNPNPPVYRIALANIAAKRQEDVELLKELSFAHHQDPQDQLPGYLLSKLKPLQVATSNVANAIPQTEVRLTQVQLAIDGLKCSCKRSMIINSFKQIRGLILTTITPKFPYQATVLIDESMISVNDVLSKIANKPLPELSYKLISSTQIKGAGEALQADLDGHNIVYAPFVNAWPELKPSL